jgi:hypothetical protein
MAKQIDCQFIPVDKLTKPVELLLNNCPRQVINNLLWSNNGYFPKVDFSIAYSDHSILLKYFVKDKYPIAKYTQINDLVYKDSCVEFFLSFNNGDNYYNLEFNCVGTPYGAYGSANNRRELPEDVLKAVKIVVNKSAADNEGITAWEITLDMPFTVFIYDKITSLKGAECKGNFYKCGDETPEPHYLSWSNILSNAPNFHVPEFFGTLNFI